MVFSLHHSRAIVNRYQIKIYQNKIFFKSSYADRDNIMNVNFLNNNQFVLNTKENFIEYSTFEDARKSHKRFKYKDWLKFYELDNILNTLASLCSTETINCWMDKKAWIIEKTEEEENAEWKEWK